MTSGDEIVQMNVRVPAWMRDIAAGYSGGPSAYVRNLIERDQKQSDSDVVEILRAQLSAKDSQIMHLQDDLHQANSALIDISHKQADVAKGYNDNIKRFFDELARKEQQLTANNISVKKGWLTRLLK